MHGRVGDPRCGNIHILLACLTFHTELQNKALLKILYLGDLSHTIRSYYLLKYLLSIIFLSEFVLYRGVFAGYAGGFTIARSSTRRSAQLRHIMTEERAAFNLNESLKFYLDNPASVPAPDADGELLDCDGNPESLTNVQINRILDPIIDAIAVSPDAIGRVSILDSLQCLLKYIPG